MATLKGEVKAFIVQSLACFDTPSQVVELVKRIWPEHHASAGRIPRPDESKRQGLAQKWVDMFNATRERFQNEISDIPIANKAYRLRALDRMMTKAESMRNMALAASLMEQAAKECGDAYSNKQKVEHTSPDGSMSPRPTTIRLVGVDPANGKPS